MGFKTQEALDERVKVSSNDTTEDFLINKLTAGSNVALVEVNDGGDEDLRIDITQATPDLQEVYDNEPGAGPALIVVDAGRTTVRVQDAAVPTGTDLFAVEDNASGTLFASSVAQNTIGVDVLPDVDALNAQAGATYSSVGNESFRIQDFRGLHGNFVHTGPYQAFGKGTAVLYGLYGNQGGLLVGSSFGSGTSSMSLGYGLYPAVGLMGNAFTGGASATSRMRHRAGAGLMVASAFAFNVTGTADVLSSGVTYGNFTGGYCVARGSGTQTIYNNASASFIWAYVQGTTGSGLATTTGAGAFVHGFIDKTVGTGAVLRGSGLGSFTQGIIRGNQAGLIEASGDGAFAQGRSAGGGTILASGNGAFAQGQAATAATPGIVAAGTGSTAMGQQQNLTHIRATGPGSFAWGRVRDNGSYIEAFDDGDFAGGYCQNGYALFADGPGAFAFGDTTLGTISATGSNVFQMGVGANATPGLQIGTDFLATPSGAHRGVRETVTLGAAATTFAIGSQSIEVTGDAGTNTIATITGGIAGQFLALQFVDGLVTITDDNTHAANSVDLSAAFTSADDTILFLYYDGTSWYEVGRSVN